MNGNDFEPLLQKGIMQDGRYVKSAPFYAEGDGTKQDVRYSPKVRYIGSLADYFELLNEIHERNEKRLKTEKKECGSLFLYRGQGNANFDYSPTILRYEEKIRREHILQKEAHRRFYTEFDKCKSIFDEEVILQHYGAGSRCLDLLENPLMALWAACEYTSNEKLKESFGEVSIWCLDYENDDLKSYDSSTVSVIADTATMEQNFSLGQLEIEYHKEHPTDIAHFIYLKDILRRCVVVRPKYNNIRFTHQFNCFAVMNLNKLVDYDGSFYKSFGITVEQFSDYILNAEVTNKDKEHVYKNPNLAWLKEGHHTLNADFSELTEWDLHFEKIAPKDSPFVDTFGMYKYMYNDSDNKNERVPIYAVVPPDAKDHILKELSYANVTNANVYPDMEIVAKELLQKFGLENI